MNNSNAASRVEVGIGEGTKPAENVIQAARSSGSQNLDLSTSTSTTGIPAAVSFQPLHSMASSPADFDISSYDTLQAHAFQLTASAGLGELALVTGTPAPAPQQQQRTQVAGGDQSHISVVDVPIPRNQQAVAHPQRQSSAIAQQGVSLATSTTSSTSATAQPHQHQQYYLTGAPPGVSIPVPQTIQVASDYSRTMTVAPGSQAPMPSNKRQVIASGESIGPAQKKRQVIFPESLATVVSCGESVVSSARQRAEEEEMAFRRRKPQVDTSKMTLEERRRHERNVREQQRSFQISSQIKELKNLLEESNISFKPNKYSILLSVTEYVKQLQARAIMLDEEHRKLTATIQQTNELVSSNSVPPSDGATSGDCGLDESEGLFVNGLDYKAVIQQCTAPLSITALDGRILECNQEFESLMGIGREELARQSLFTLLQDHENIFRAMGEMLTEDDVIEPPSIDDTAITPQEQPLKYYSGVVAQANQDSLKINITLTRAQDGNPRFFNCAMTTATT